MKDTKSDSCYNKIMLYIINYIYSNYLTSEMFFNEPVFFI